MDRVTKKDFEVWRKKERWLLIGEGKNNEGFPQVSFLTPAGKVIFVIYDAEDNLRNVAFPMAAPMPSMTQGRSALDFRGGSAWPPGFTPPR